MLNRTLINRIKACLMGSLYLGEDAEEDKARMAEFVAASPDEQFQRVLEVCRADPATRKLEEGVLRAFVLVFRLHSKQTAPGSDEHRALRADVGPGPLTAWDKDNPPTDPLDLMDRHRQPSWADEFDACASVAREVSHADASDPEAVAMAVKHCLGIGGFEDTAFPGALGPDDPTMRIFISLVARGLVSLRPEWFDGATLLPKEKLLEDGVDLRSAAEIDAEQQARLEAEAKERRRLRDIEQREQERRAKAALRETVYGVIWTCENTVHDLTAVADKIAAMEHPEARAYLLDREDGSFLPARLVALVRDWDDILAPFLPSDADELEKVTDEDVDRARNQAVTFCEQWVLNQVASQRPRWFKTLVDGDVKIRKSVPADRPPVPRQQITCRNHIVADIKKYGMENVIQAIRYHVTNLPPEFVPAWSDEAREAAKDDESQDAGTADDTAKDDTAADDLLI